MARGMELSEVEKRRDEVKKKLERGEPLTLEELKLIYGFYE